MRIKKKELVGLEDFEKKHGALTLGRFIESWRLSEHTTQRAFAQKLGISPANLCDIEKGRKGVSISKAIEIAKKIGYSPTVLVQLTLQELINSSGLDCTVELRKNAA